MDKKSIGLDFDGVIHEYDHHWVGAQFITGKPVPGAIDFLRNLSKDECFEIYILSSRSNNPEFEPALKEWLHNNGLEYEYISDIKVVANKPPLWIYIDDRAMKFTGIFPSMKELIDFTSWDMEENKKPEYLKRMYNELKEIDNFLESDFFNETVNRCKRLEEFINYNIYDEDIIKPLKFDKDGNFKPHVDLSLHEKELLKLQYDSMINSIDNFKSYRRFLQNRIDFTENKLKDNKE